MLAPSCTEASPSPNVWQDDPTRQICGQISPKMRHIFFGTDESLG